MSKIYYTADWHLGDERMNLFPRHFKDAEDFYEFLKDKWNSIVEPDDVVFHLGDVVAQTTDVKWLERTSEFNGKKHLIKGNYDDIFSKEQYNEHFETVCIDCQVQNINRNSYYHLVHYPSLGRSDMFNLVGHIHATWKCQRNMLNVGIDVNHYRPYSEEDVEFMHTAITKYYDVDVFAGELVQNKSHRATGKRTSYADKI